MINKKNSNGNNTRDNNNNNGLNTPGNKMGDSKKEKEIIRDGGNAEKSNNNRDGSNADKANNNRDGGNADKANNNRDGGNAEKSNNNRDGNNAEKSNNVKVVSNASNTERNYGSFRALVQLTQLGFTMAASIFVGVLFGRYLDSLLGTEPWLLLVFSLLGVAAAIKTLFYLN